MPGAGIPMPESLIPLYRGIKDSGMGIPAPGILNPPIQGD